MVNTAGTRDTLVMRYSGLGQLVESQAAVYGNAQPEPTFRGTETYKYDGLDNVFASTGVGSTRYLSQRLTTTRTGDPFYTKGTGRLRQTSNWVRAPYAEGTREITRTDQFGYDAAGNLEFSTQIYNAGSCDSQSKDEADCEDRASFYAADGTLAAAEHRTRAGTDGGGRWDVAFEEYRYDALGRRIWVRNRTACGGRSIAGGPASCLSTLRRTVWDGQQELWEIQMPGADTSSHLENDMGPIPIRSYRSWWSMPCSGCQQGPVPTDFFEYDPNAFFGRVAYTSGLGVDRPLSVLRIGLQRYWPDESIFSMSGQETSFSPFVLVPTWDWRSQADGARFTDGSQRRCETFPNGTFCIDAGVRDNWFAYDTGDIFFQQWHGRPC